MRIYFFYETNDEYKKITVYEFQEKKIVFNSQVDGFAHVRLKIGKMWSLLFIVFFLKTKAVTNKT